jgi:PAS domain S-box-containing protein
MHSVLRRQLRRLGLQESGPPPDADAWRALLGAFDALCHDNDRDRYMLERSISISSQEMQALYHELRQSSETELAIERDRLEHSVAMLNAALDTAPDAVMVVDVQRQVVAFNKNLLRMWGIDADIARRRGDEALVQLLRAQVNDPDEAAERIADLYARPEASRRDELHLLDGRIIDRFSAPVRALAGGQCHGRMWLFRDVTVQHNAVDEARRLNGFLDSIFENLPEMVFVKEATTLEYVRFNRAGEELLGLPRSAVIGRTARDLYPPDQAELFIEKDYELLDRGGVVETEEVVETPHLGPRLLHTRKIPISDDTGRPAYIMGISHDITELKRHEEDLEKARDAAEAASRAKSEFLANMSHELRTPLNAIIGFTEIMQDGLHGPLNERQQVDVGHVLDSSRHLLRLINDILDLARVEAGRTELCLVELDIFDAVRDAVSLISPLAQKKAIRLTVLPGPDGGLPVRADEVRLKQILCNLLGNAVKFTPDGGFVEVGARVGADGKVVTSVRDTGIGIAEADRERVFAAFEQVDSSYGRREQGTGLGLSLTRRLVELHGGLVWVQSRIGEGSTFRFTLPSPPRAPARRRAHLSSAGIPALRPGARVLIIEDNETNLELIASIIESGGCEVLSATSAEVGLTIAQNELPALVLLDIGLPGMDGFAAVEILKRDARTARIPVVAVTAHALPADEARARAAGFDDYLTKPIRPKLLRATIGRLLCDPRFASSTMATRDR